MIGRLQRASVVAIDERSVVRIVHHEIEGAISVEVRVCRAVPEARSIQPPARRLIRESQVALIAIGVVPQLRRGHRAGKTRVIDVLVLRRRFQCLLVAQERNVILRRHVLGDSVGDVDVLVAIEVEIRDERAPAPVGARDAGHLPDVAERSVAVVQLQHVAHQLVMKAVLHFGLVRAPSLERRRRAQAILVLRQHVRRIDVRPAVVVYVRDVQPHREIGEIGHLLVQLLGERAVVVVDVEIVALEEIVRYVDVRPPIAVDVAHSQAEPERDLAAVYARLRTYVGEMPVAIVVK